jgi:metacaspase-1
MAKRTTSRTRSTRTAARGRRESHVVYVHGICAHAPGYSDAWWDALNRHLDGASDRNRHEVLWSRHVTPVRAVAAETFAAAELPPEEALDAEVPHTEEALLAEHLRDVLIDRAEHVQIEAMRETAAHAPDVPLIETAVPAAGLRIPGVRCVGDFVKYLLQPSIRTKVIHEFDKVVHPLLGSGRDVTVISHSWGTVVAYEAMRRMDSGRSDLPNGGVGVFFTVGSALAIRPVKRRLLPEARDGLKPRVVETWVNLNARADVVGGPLRGAPFQVDFEYLDLPPTGCPLRLPSPQCSHSSYFHPDNTLVNRDVFAKHIRRG